MTKKKVLIFSEKIEKNLINLLKNINYNKYEIDLMLKEKQNSKKDITKKVNIIEYKINIILTGN